MLFQKLLGTNASGSNIAYIGSVTKTAADESGWDQSAEALNVLSIAQTGDLVVIAFSLAASGNISWSWAGMSFTSTFNRTDTTNPGTYVGYRFIQSGDSNPYVTGLNSGDWAGLSIVASVFRNVNGYVSVQNSSGATGLPDPPSLTATGKLGVITGHIDNDAVTNWGAPSGYTLASSTSITGGNQSSTVIAYQIGSFTSQTPAAFTGTGTDAWRATTMAFN